MNQEVESIVELTGGGGGDEGGGFDGKTDEVSLLFSDGELKDAVIPLLFPFTVGAVFRVGGIDLIPTEDLRLDR